MQCNSQTSAPKQYDQYQEESEYHVRIHKKSREEKINSV